MITIIVTLIIAGISVATLTGDNGIFNQAQDAKLAKERDMERDKLTTSILESNDKFGELNATLLIQNIKANIEGVETVTASGEDNDKLPVTVTYSNGNISKIGKDGTIIGPLPEVKAGVFAPKDSNAYYKDSDGNIAVIPAGFSVSNVAGENSIPGGLVIIDENQNEFVWIPVGTIKNGEEEKTIELGRYVFNEDGSINTTLSNPKNGQLKISSNSSVYFTEFLFTDNNVKEAGTQGSNGNIIAKDINEFIKKANQIDGFYIGRYEARTTSSEIERAENTDDLTAVTENSNNMVYRYITQPNAAIQAKTMYTKNSNFEVDLMNSYAWDTTILFLQIFGTNPTYSKEKAIDFTYANKGTNNTEKKDIQCNVYDIASNCYEWTTEANSNDSGSCVRRGGWYLDDSKYSSHRDSVPTDIGGYFTSFRPILYIK